MNMLKAISRRVANLSPNCREASRLQSLALDGPLSFSQRLGLRIHLLLCRWCRRYGKQLSFLRVAARKLVGEDLGLPRQGLSPEARERLKKILQTGDK